MILLEVLNKSVPFNWTDASTAVFMAGDVEYTVVYQPDHISYDGPGYYMDFYARGGKVRATQGITGTGNELVVFSTVVEITKQFVQKERVQILAFSAHEPSRVKLYDALVRRFKGSASLEIRPLLGRSGKEYVLTFGESNPQ